MKAAFTLTRLGRGFVGRREARRRWNIVRRRFTCKNCGRAEPNGNYCKGCGYRRPSLEGEAKPVGTGAAVPIRRPRATSAETRRASSTWPGDDDADSLSKKWHETFFDAEAHALHPDLRALDSTPSYLLQSNLAIPRLQRMRKDLPLIVMVRDPALRAVSHHAMIADKAATPQQRRSRGTAWLGKSVREVAEAELVELLRAGVLRCVGGDGLGGDYEVDDAASARSATTARPVIREFFEGPSMFYNDGLNPLLPDRSEEPQRKRRRIKPGPVKVGQPDPHARFVALLWGPRKRL